MAAPWPKSSSRLVQAHGCVLRRSAGRLGGRACTGQATGLALLRDLARSIARRARSHLIFQTVGSSDVKGGLFQADGNFFSVTPSEIARVARLIL
jgi:hypothetical protein